jgi:hypothetical protein
MDAMYEQVANVKSYYAYLQNMYADYKQTFPYLSYTEYAYSQYGTKSENELLQYFIEGAIQPYLINEAIEEYNLIDLFVPTLEDYFTRYFSLNISHLIINVDFDEDGAPDDYNEYYDGLTLVEQGEFDILISDFEDEITAYLDLNTTNTLTKLVSDYRNASRENETWGPYKQEGLLLITEDLNIKDEKDEKIKHSLEYSGTYGVKDTYVQEYVDALVALYQKYNDPQYINQTSLRSILVKTEFGAHLIVATKGDNFEKFTALFAEANPSSPVYSEGSVNPEGAPSLEQMKLYAKYYFYKTVYDLSDTEVESKYGITLPKLPSSVSSAMEYYFDGILAKIYVVGTVNIRVADRMIAGEFFVNEYNSLNDTDLKAKLSTIHDVYYDALYGEYDLGN